MNVDAVVRMAEHPKFRLILFDFGIQVCCEKSVQLVVWRSTESFGHALPTRQMMRYNDRSSLVLNSGLQQIQNFVAMIIVRFQNRIWGNRGIGIRRFINHLKITK